MEQRVNKDGRAQVAEKVGFGKIGEDGGNTVASCMTQGIFVVHHDRTGAVLSLTKGGVMRGESWTRQSLKDACDPSNWDALCGFPWKWCLQKRNLQRTSQQTKKESWKELQR